MAKELDADGKLPAVFMVVAPGSWNDLEVWDDINRMRTLNTTQSRRRPADACVSITVRYRGANH